MLKVHRRRGAPGSGTAVCGYWVPSFDRGRDRLVTSWPLVTCTNCIIQHKRRKRRNTRG